MAPEWLQQQTWLPRGTSGLIDATSGPATRPEEEAVLLTDSQHRSTASCDQAMRTPRGKASSRFAALLAVFIVGLSIATSSAGAAALSSGPQSAPATLTGTALYGSFAQLTASTDGAPTLDSAGYVDDGVSLSFTAPSVTTGATITSYDYEISTDGGFTIYGTFNTANYVGFYGDTSATASPFTDPNGPGVCGQNNTTCAYQIRADLSTGTQTPWSSWVTVAPSLTAPTLDSAVSVDDGVSLSFTAPSEPTGATITSYDYEISTDGGFTIYGTFNTANYVGFYGDTNATASPFTDPNGPGVCGQNNTTCAYRIRAEIGADDTWQTPWSSWVTVAPSLTAPTLDSAVSVDDGVSLSFTAPSEPTGATITSYDYEISTDGGTTMLRHLQHRQLRRVLRQHQRHGKSVHRPEWPRRLWAEQHHVRLPHPGRDRRRRYVADTLV